MERIEGGIDGWIYILRNRRIGIRRDRRRDRWRDGGKN